MAPAQAADLGVAVVGLRQGWEHVAALAAGVPGLRLAALCDRDDALLAERLAELTAQGVAVTGHTDMDAALGDPAVEAAVIALPHGLHPLAVEAAVTHGTHLLKEKPIGRTLAEAHGMAQAMRRAGLVLHTGVQRRHHGSYVRLRDHLEGQTVRSALLTISIRVTGQQTSGGWRDDGRAAGGGVLLDLGYHGVDLLHFLLGPLEPVSCLLQAPAGTVCPTDEIEHVAAIWARAGPVWIHMRFGRGDEKREQLVLETSRGVIEASREQVELRREDGRVEQLCEGAKDWSTTMHDQLATFAGAVSQGVRGVNDLPDQLPAIRFIEQAYALGRADGAAGLAP